MILIIRHSGKVKPKTIKGLVCHDLGGGMSRWSTEDV